MAHVHLPHDHGRVGEALMEQLPSAQEFQKVSRLMWQLSDPTRLQLFWLLCHCEECVINLSAMMNMTSPAISHHLKQLRESELIVSRREGKEVYYRAADSKQAQLLHAVIEQMISIACPGAGV